MEMDSKILEEFPTAKVLNDELFLPIETGIHFAEFCRNQGVAIIGLDFFHIQDNKVKPVNPIRGMDCSEFTSTHSSWSDVVDACTNLAIKVFEDELKIDANEYYCPAVDYQP